MKLERRSLVELSREKRLIAQRERSERSAKKMIRPNKPVKLLEWGQGTTTLNQVWSEIGTGTIRSHPQKDGLTTLVIELTGPFEKKNKKDDSIKIAQQGEGMAARSEMWGEVAMGKLRSTESDGGKSVVYIDILTAAKISNAIN